MLAGLGLDVDGLTTANRFVTLDPHQVLPTLLVDGSPDRHRFRAAVRGVIDDIHRAHGHVRVAGEMVALLWGDGQALAAMELESLWHELAEDGTFSLFCAYPSTLSGSDPASWRQIQPQHTQVTRERDDPIPVRGAATSAEA